MSDLDDTAPTQSIQLDGGDPIATFSLRRRRGVVVTSAAAIALGLAVVGGGGAGAASTSPPTQPAGSSASGGRPTMGGSPPAAVGTVASVGAGTFTLTTNDKKRVTVKVGSATTFRDPSVTSATIADVTVGQHVAVFGTDATDVVTATSVAIGEPPGRGKGATKNGRPGGSPPSNGGSGSASDSSSG